MKTFHECLPCFVKQTLESLQRSGATDDQIRTVMRTVFYTLATVNYDEPPPVIAGKIHRMLRNVMKNPDPYGDDKRRFNDFALRILNEMRVRIDARQNTFSDSVRLAIAANIIDSGKNANLTESDALVCLEKSLETPLDNSVVRQFEEAVLSVDSILFLCDNAGEIIFDRFLIEQMPYRKIICAVRGNPVINDATIEDARIAGLTDIVKVISNGSDVPGTALQECSQEFRQVFNDADLVIAKGQGNFETLSEITNKRIFFLLQVKCPIIARDFGLPVGTLVIKDNFIGQTMTSNELKIA